MTNVRILIAKKDGAPEALADALGGETPEGASILTAGIIQCDSAEFVGIDKPDAPSVNLFAPDPVEGEPEGWLYFNGSKWAAYTEDLVALRIPRD